MSHVVIRQNWREYEQGWGSKPDGFTLHLDHQDRDSFVAGYYKTWHTTEEPPNVYEAVEGIPQPFEVSDEIWKKLVEVKQNNPSPEYPHEAFGLWNHHVGLK